MPEVFDLSQFDSYREGNRLEVKAANGGLPGSISIADSLKPTFSSASR